LLLQFRFVALLESHLFLQDSYLVFEMSFQARILCFQVRYQYLKPLVVLQQTLDVLASVIAYCVNVVYLTVCVPHSVPPFHLLRASYCEARNPRRRVRSPRLVPESIAQAIPDFCKQLDRVNRLCNVVGTSAAVTPFDIRGLASGGNQDDWDLAGILLFAHFAAGVESVHHGHHYVHKDEIRPLRRRFGYGFPAIPRGHKVVLPVEDHPLHEEDGFRIVHYEDFLSFHCSFTSESNPLSQKGASMSERLAKTI
jgi:hypothetical protein